jgi:mitotic spindle assembly checkpoint protein MAD1
MSSPFVDHPHEAVTRLEFEVSLAHTERLLLEESKRQLQLQYEALLQAKNDELEAMRTNVEFLAEQRDAAASKSSNVADTSRHQIEQLQQAAAADRRELARVRRRHDEAEAQAREAACREEHARIRAEGAEHEARQLRERCRELQQQNERLAQQPTPVAPLPPPRHDTALQTKVAVLEKTNALLSIKVDQLLQHKTSVEVLRQKNHELTQRLARLEETQERCCALELEVMEARAKWREFEDVAGDAPLLRAFAAQLRQLQDSNLVLQQKFDQSCVERDDALARLAQAREQADAERAKAQSLSEVLRGRQELIDKLERQKLLNAKEIEYLRELLKIIDPITPAKAAVVAALPHAQHEEMEEQLRQRVKQLEEAVATREAQLRERHGEATSAKRPRPSSLRSPTRSPPRSPPPHSLENENARLLAHTKTLEGRVCALEAELQQQQRLQAKRQQLRVLQLRTNFASADQAIKQETLDALRRENEALLAGASGAGASVPRAVFERQVHDQLQLEAKVDQLTKRMTRLRELYARKSCDILLIISKFFGYSVEFLPSAVNPQDLTSLRIKLTSKYLGDAHLIIDVHSKLLKASGLDEFRELCGRLVASWVKGKDQIPCFLGALNLSLYDAAT